MANTITALGTRAIKALGRGKVTKTKVAIDTVDTDVTVIAATADKQTAIVGGSSSKASSATTVTFKSGSNVIGVIVIASGTALSEGIMNRIVSGLVTNTNEALVVQSDVAIDLYLDTVQGGVLESGLPAV